MLDEQEIATIFKRKMGIEVKDGGALESHKSPINQLQGNRQVKSLKTS